MFLSESGYFSAAAEEKPLLHIWSLGVEEQFYLLFPLILFGLYRLSKGGITWTICCLGVASFVLSLSVSENYPSANFYLLFSRAWELLLGSFVALRLGDLRSSRSGRLWDQVIDIVTLTFMLALLNFIFSWAGESYAGPFDLLLPVVATAGIIALVRPGTLIHKALSHKWLVHVGLISYSLYLWHQPVLAYARILSTGELAHETAWICISLSFLMAIFSWRYVERPFRNRQSFSRINIYLLSSLGLFLFAVVGLSLHFNNGFPQRVVIEGSTNEKFAATAIFREWDFSGYPAPEQVRQVNGAEVAGAGGGSHYILVGDSHALQYWYGMANFAEKSQGSEVPIMASLTPASFPPTFNELPIPGNTKYVVFSYFWSLKFGDETVENQIRCCGDGPGGTLGRPTDVIPHDQRVEMLAQFTELFTRLIETGIVPVIILDNPFGKELNAKSLLSISRAAGLTVSLNDTYASRVPRDVLEDRRSISVDLLQSLPMRDQIIFVDPYEQLCGDDFCEVVNSAGNFIYKDYDHLAHSVAVGLVPYIFEYVSGEEKSLAVY